MPSSIIRGVAVFTEPIDRRDRQHIDDGAAVQHDGVIAEIGSFAELSARHPDVPVIGTGRQVVLPGFVNGHHHIGLSPGAARLARHASGAVVRDPAGDPACRSLSRYPLFRF